MMFGDGVPKGRGQSGPVQQIDEEGQVTLAESLLEFREGGTLAGFEIAGMTHDEIVVAGVVRGAVYAAAVGPHLFVREMGGDEPPQLLHMLGSKREREVSHVFVAGFRRGRGRRAENR